MVWNRLAWEASKLVGLRGRSRAEVKTVTNPPQSVEISTKCLEAAVILEVKKVAVVAVSVVDSAVVLEVVEVKDMGEAKDLEAAKVMEVAKVTVEAKVGLEVAEDLEIVEDSEIVVDLEANVEVSEAVVDTVAEDTKLNVQKIQLRIVIYPFSL